MIGLEYILALYNISHSELAKELNIKRQNINQWIKGKGKIPKKYIPILSKKFTIPEEYFQKQIDDMDELDIQRIKLNNEIKNYEYEYEDTFIDPDTGEEITITQTDVDYGALFAIDLNTYQIKKKVLLKSIKNSLDQCFIDAEKDDNSMDYGLSDANEILSLYEEFLSLVNNENIHNNTLKNVLIGIKFAYGRAFSSDELVAKIAKVIKEYDAENKKW